MIQQSDLFDEPHIIIEKNPLLERVANDVLDLVQHRPELLSGDNIGVIDRRISVCLWLDSGLRQILSDVELRKQVTTFLADPQKCVSFDVVSRARRLLVAEDKIRLSKSAIENGIRQKNKVEQSLRK